MLLLVATCAGFGWDRVNFLHSSWYGATFWICADHSVDDTGMFSLLLSRIKASSASRPTPPASRLGLHKKMGGDAAKTADPN